MNNLNPNDPLDLADALNNDDDDTYSLHPATISSSNNYEHEDFLTLCSSSKFKNNFSMLSLNICSLNSKYEELCDFINDLQNKPSFICLHEVWSITCEYPITGYQTREFSSCDMHLPQPNRNCGGGVGIYIDEHLTYTKLDFPNSFIHGVF